MGKSKKNRAAATKQIQLKSQTTAEAFSFGDPIHSFWTAENYWTMWNAYRWTVGMSRPSALTDWRAPSALQCITVPRLQ